MRHRWANAGRETADVAIILCHNNPMHRPLECQDLWW